MDIMIAVQANYPTINFAAGEYLKRLSMTGIEKDIVIAAEMAGLMLLRNSNVDLTRIPSGTAILGAISDETTQTMSRYIASWAMSNGLNPKEVDVAGIPAGFKAYFPGLSAYEKPLLDICENARVAPELVPFVAATAAMKLVAAGKALSLLEVKIGQAMVIYHIIAGSKTVPFPAVKAS